MFAETTIVHKKEKYNKYLILCCKKRVFVKKTQKKSSKSLGEKREF